MIKNKYYHYLSIYMPRGSQATDSDKIVVNINLVGKNKEMFEKLMEQYNLSYNTEVFLFILKKAYILEFGKDNNT